MLLRGDGARGDYRCWAGNRFARSIHRFALENSPANVTIGQQAAENLAVRTQYQGPGACLVEDSDGLGD